MLGQLVDIFGGREWQIFLVLGLSCPLLGVLYRWHAKGLFPQRWKLVAPYYVVALPLLYETFTGVGGQYVFCYLLIAAFRGFPLGAVAARSWTAPVLTGSCRKCGYDLTGNVSGVCPECGEDLDAHRGSG